MNTKQKILTILAIFFVLISVVIIGFRFKKVIFNGTGSSVSKTNDLTRGGDIGNKNNINESSSQLKCQDGWKDFHQDLLGIAFCYPNEWGEPVLEPVKKPTKLEGIVDKQSETEDNAYSNSLGISFSAVNKEVTTPEIRIFNEVYKGERYSNSYAHQYGYVDNIDALKDANDICAYKVNFNTPYEGKLNEIWTDCRNKTKANLVENIEFFDFDNIGTLYTYKLKLWSFKKIANGYFDNVLISSTVDSTRQITEKLETIDEFFDAKKTTREGKLVDVKGRENLNKQREIFEDFSNSIVSYKPVLRQQVEFKEIPEEDQNITSIRKYYWLLENGKTDEAYAMKFKPDKVNIDEFRKNYADIYMAEPFDFRAINKNLYEFHVKYQDHNTPETEFRIQMKVNSGFLETVYVEEYQSEIARFGEDFAYATKRGEKVYVVLNKNGKEILVDEGLGEYKEDNSNVVEVVGFSDVKFSKSGKYLQYNTYGWEYMGLIIYDAINMKKISEIGYPSGYGFSDDEKYFFMCTSAGIATGPDGWVYSMSEFKEEYSLLSDPRTKGYIQVDCEIKGNTIDFKLSEFYSEDGSYQPEKNLKMELDLVTMQAK